MNSESESKSTMDPTKHFSIGFTVQAVIACLELPSSTIDIRGHGEPVIEEAHSVGPNDPEGGIFHVVITMKVAGKTLDVYNCLTVYGAKPRLAQLTIHYGGVLAVRQNCSFYRNGCSTHGPRPPGGPGPQPVALRRSEVTFPSLTRRTPRVRTPRPQPVPVRAQLGSGDQWF